jgi:magnesium chelatase subunit H
VIIAGFEAFNLPLYRRAAAVVSQAVPSSPVQVFTDIDLDSDQTTVEKALRNADVVLMSLIFDYSQVEWLRKSIEAGVCHFNKSMYYLAL